MQRRQERRHMTQSENITKPSGRIWLDDDDHASGLAAGLRFLSPQGILEARLILNSPCLVITDPLPPLVAPLPDGLRTPAEAARKLRCSIKTLFAHVASGALRYVDIGRGTKRPHRMFTDADLDAFIT